MRYLKPSPPASRRRGNRSLYVYLACPLLLGSAGATCTSPGGAGNGITLTELWATPLPVEWGVPTGLWIRGDTVLAWSAEESFLLVASGGFLSRIDLPGTRPLAGRLVGGRITIVETNPPAIVEMPVDGSAETRTPFNIPGQLRSAAWVEGAWYLSVGDESLVALYQVRRPDGSARRVGSLPTPGHLSSSASALLVAGYSPPFEVSLVDLSGKLMRSCTTLGSAADSLVRSWPDGLWVSMPPMELLGGDLLQTVTDVRSDRRLLLRYSRTSSTPVRTTEVNLPMALLAADPHQRRVAGIRNINNPELVVYRW